jgi:proline dehydrogenase
MEGYNLFDKTLNVHKQLCKSYFGVGIVVQSYLYRAQEVIESAIQNVYSVRLCKGAYKEPSTVAFQNKEDVDKNYIKLAFMLLKNSEKFYERYNRLGPQFCGIGIATHDHKIINSISEFVKDNHISKQWFEFQMLYGVRPHLQNELIAQGFNVRLYIPFGKDWFGYTIRRMAERPANLMFVLKNIFS